MIERILVEILTYAGLLLATASSAWGLLHDTSTKDERGRKRLTSAGRVSLGLVVFGLLISITSRLVTSRLDNIQAGERIAEERLRLIQLAASSQPLQSIRLRWEFSGLPTKTLHELKAGVTRAKQTIADDDVHKYQSAFDRAQWFEALYRYEVVYPWFHYLATGQWEARPNVVVRIPLYESGAVVLPFGNLPASQALKASAGIDSVEFWYADPANFDEEFLRQRQRLPALQSSIVLEGNHLVIEMWIEAESMQQSLDKLSTNIEALAQVPQAFDVFVLGKIQQLPWQASNFAGRPRDSEAVFTSISPLPFDRCTLKIIPNNLVGLSATYTVTFEGQGRFLELKGPESEDQLYCLGATLRAVRKFDR